MSLSIPLYINSREHQILGVSTAMSLPYVKFFVWQSNPLQLDITKFSICKQLLYSVNLCLDLRESRLLSAKVTRIEPSMNAQCTHGACRAGTVDDEWNSRMQYTRHTSDSLCDKGHGYLHFTFTPSLMQDTPSLMQDTPTSCKTHPSSCKTHPLPCKTCHPQMSSSEHVIIIFITSNHL